MKKFLLIFLLLIGLCGSFDAQTIINPYSLGAPYSGGGGTSAIATAAPVVDLFPHANAFADGALVETAKNYGSSVDGTASNLSRRPFFHTGGANGKSYYEFDGDRFLQFAGLPAMTAVEAIIVVQKNTDIPTAAYKRGLWGSDANMVTDFPNQTDGVIYDGFGSTARKTVGNPTPDLAAAPFIYNVVSVSNEWTARLNTTPLFTTTTNTVSMQTNWKFGADDTITYLFDGKLYRLLVFDRKLTTQERADILAELKALFSLTGY